MFWNLWAQDIQVRLSTTHSLNTNIWRTGSPAYSEWCLTCAGSRSWWNWYPPEPDREAPAGHCTGRTGLTPLEDWVWVHVMAQIYIYMGIHKSDGRHNVTYTRLIFFSSSCFNFSTAFSWFFFLSKIKVHLTSPAVHYITFHPIVQTNWNADYNMLEAL